LSMRTALSGIGPKSWLTGRRLMKTWRQNDPEGARVFEERALGGGVYRTTQKTTPYRRAEQFEGSALEGTVRAMAAFNHAPGIRHAIQAVNEVAKAVFYGN